MFLLVCLFLNEFGVESLFFFLLPSHSLSVYTSYRDRDAPAPVRRSGAQLVEVGGEPAVDERLLAHFASPSPSRRRRVDDGEARARHQAGEVARRAYLLDQVLLGGVGPHRARDAGAVVEGVDLRREDLHRPRDVGDLFGGDQPAHRVGDAPERPLGGPQAPRREPREQLPGAGLSPGRPVVGQGGVAEDRRLVVRGQQRRRGDARGDGRRGDGAAREAGHRGDAGDQQPGLDEALGDPRVEDEEARGAREGDRGEVLRRGGGGAQHGRVRPLRSREDDGRVGHDERGDRGDDAEGAVEGRGLGRGDRGRVPAGEELDLGRQGGGGRGGACVCRRCGSRGGGGGSGGGRGGEEEEEGQREEEGAEGGRIPRVRPSLRPRRPGAARETGGGVPVHLSRRGGWRKRREEKKKREGEKQSKGRQPMVSLSRYCSVLFVFSRRPVASLLFPCACSRRNYSAPHNCRVGVRDKVGLFGWAKKRMLFFPSSNVARRRDVLLPPFPRYCVSFER